MVKHGAWRLDKLFVWNSVFYLEFILHVSQGLREFGEMLGVNKGGVNTLSRIVQLFIFITPLAFVRI